MTDRTETSDTTATADTTGDLTILFLCTGNSCRSQMAEGWARHLYPGRVRALSAGVAPKGLDPRAVAVMAEAGVDISGQGSHHVDDFLDEPLDLVVTVCDGARESCPIFPRPVRTLHHSFDDPPYLVTVAQEGGAMSTEEAALAPYRRVRDEIRAFVAALPARPDC